MTESELARKIIILFVIRYIYTLRSAGKGPSLFKECYIWLGHPNGTRHAKCKIIPLEIV